MNEPLVHCIILSYNGKQLTLDCLASVMESDYTNFCLVVVDNASSDGSAEAIRSTFDGPLLTGRMVLIQNERNLGFAGGNNVGIDHAVKHGADYVLLLNNDTTVDKRLLSELIIKAQADPSIGIAGPKIYYHQPPDMIWFAGGEIKLHKGLSRHIGIRQKDAGQYGEMRDCDYITGCAMLIRKSVIERVGLLDTAYRMYSEDADYCMRARQAGFRMAYIPSGKVWHRISAATGGQLKWRKIRLRLFSNLVFLMRYARWYHWLSIPWFFVADAVRVLIAVVSGRIKN